MKIIDITSKIPACNYSINRKCRPEAIVFHITGDSRRSQSVEWFEDPASKVSAHYIIEKNGDVFMCVHPEHKAYHCGIINQPTALIYNDKGQLNPNTYTIGIECVSSGEPLEDGQYAALIQLTHDLCSIYRIPRDRYHLIGHFELDSVGRKYDPIASYSVDEVVKTIRELEAVKVTFEEALKIQVDEGVINSPEYWRLVCATTKNFEQYAINVSKKIQELKSQIK